MTKKDLIKRLQNINDDTVIVISDGEGWSNIEKLVPNGSVAELLIEKHSVFN